MNKLVYLRGCWDSEELHFDKKGKLREPSGQISIMLCGFVPASVQLEGKKLVLKGSRAGLAVQNDDLEQVSSAALQQVEIDTPPGGDYGPVLAKVFAPTLADMAPMLPDYWQKYAREHFSQAVPLVANMNLDSIPSRKLGPKSGIAPPQLIKSAEPEISLAALHSGFKDSVLVAMWVGIDGIPYHFSIARSAGQGLDESALAAVRQYRFKPSTENGKPIPVEVRVEVNFEVR
ncbi:MAG: energy transducer TonB [Acidobacteriaceae bacterium]|nr:energy transducer TonB [Acidobacteriaceae bacterium]